MKKVLFAVLSFALLVGCATPASRSFASVSEFDKTFAACKQAAVDAGFGITSVSGADGFISAQRGLGFGSVEVMNIQVTRNPSGCNIQLSVVPPSGGWSVKGSVEKFTTALRNRVPDVAVSGQ